MSNRTIYIVDDNVEFLESTRFWLSGAGFDVKTCSDTRVAYEVYDSVQLPAASCP